MVDAWCSLVLCGKSSLETDAATRLKNNHVLKLPDDTQVSLLLQPEATHLLKDCFDPSSFLNSIWSPRLSSTHDLVSHNFSELPLGSVRVTDIQFKGRGRTNNVWESPRGCLMYSFTLEMGDGRLVPLIHEQRVIVEEMIKDQVIQNVVIIQGLTSSGYLLAVGDDNQMYELHPDGNSFDFFKGLVRRKL